MSLSGVGLDRYDGRQAQLLDRWRLGSSTMVSMNRLDTAKRSQIVRCLVEGIELRSTVRMTGASKNTVAKLLIELGAACKRYVDETMVNLPCQRLQADEIWSLIGSKRKNVQSNDFEDGGYGDVWTWTAIDANTKLIPCWMLGSRDSVTAREFISNLAGRLAKRVQLTTEGPKAYLTAVDSVLGEGIDYTQLDKIYNDRPEGLKLCSPTDCVGCEGKNTTGDCDPASMPRVNRQTNTFGRKLENHAASVAIYFTWYNFGRVHQTLKTTPAIKAGIANHVWKVEEMLGLLEAVKPKSTRPAVSN